MRVAVEADLEVAASRPRPLFGVALDAHGIDLVGVRIVREAVGEGDDAGLRIEAQGEPRRERLGAFGERTGVEGLGLRPSARSVDGVAQAVAAGCRLDAGLDQEVGAGRAHQARHRRRYQRSVEREMLALHRGGDLVDGNQLGRGRTLECAGHEPPAGRARPSRGPKRRWRRRRGGGRAGRARPARAEARGGSSAPPVPRSPPAPAARPPRPRRATVAGAAGAAGRAGARGRCAPPRPRGEPRARATPDGVPASRSRRRRPRAARWPPGRPSPAARDARRHGRRDGR